MEEQRGIRRELVGTVIGRKMKKTAVVRVTRRVKHPFYGKFVTVVKKYYAHDEKEQTSVGDTVRLVESKPLSRLKRWRLKQIIEKSIGREE